MERQTPQPSQPPSAPLDILILAAGLGTRMRSSTAKVLHKLGGRPLIAHVCRTASALVKGERPVYVVVGHQAGEVEEAVRAELGEGGAVFVTQTEQRGTGDAPLVRAETLGSLVHQHRTHRGRGAACTLMAVRLEDPTGYGRVIRDEEGRFQKIVEQKDATPEERQVGEINAGIYCFETRLLFPALERVKPENSQGEFYLTDVPGILRVELSEFERILRLRTLRSLMLNSGVTVIDPQHTYVSPDAQIGRDTTLHPNVHVEGRSVIGEGCEIGQGSRITDSRVGNGVTVKDHCVVVDSEVADHRVV